MKVIIEKDEEGSLYIYRETEKVFKINEKDRKKEGFKQVDIKIMDIDCHYSNLPPHSYIVLELKK